MKKDNIIADVMTFLLSASLLIAALLVMFGVVMDEQTFFAMALIALSCLIIRSVKT